MVNSIIEISKKTSKAGRTPVKFILHEIYDSDKKYNANGISWKREFVEENMESVKSMPLVAQFLDDTNTIPFGAHGELNVKDGNVTFEDSLVVGSFENVYIQDDIEVNGKTINALIGSGYVFDQRFPELVTYLQEQYDNGNPVESSIEICADKSKGNTKILYEDGWKEKGRIPKSYQYSGHALVVGVEPSDKTALLLELNTKKKEVKDLSSLNQVIETNKMNYNDVVALIENVFNTKFNENKSNYYYFCIHKFYPEDSTFVMKTWSQIGEYYQSSYKIEDSKLVIGDIIKVTENWEPVNGSKSVEVNSVLLNIYNKQNKEVKTKMDEKIVLELNQKIEDKTNEINTLNKDIEAKVTEINSLNTKISDLDAKVTELSDTIVEVNKKLETEKTEKENLTVEVNTFREEKAKNEADAKKAEVNTYFETEIPKNGFEEAEINSLKEYVKKCDLDGLKNAEKELVFKKFKDAKANESIETNSTNSVSNMFISTKKVDENKVNAGKIPTFFN